MKKKGFTLIELLAVIVVLAIIALIATPIVLNLINNARVGAAEQSATGYVKAIENAIMKDMLNDENISDGTYKYDYLSIDISGNVPTDGEYKIASGKVENANFCISGYTIEYKNGKSKKVKDNCDIVEGPTKIEASSTDTHKGIVYLDPTDLSKTCNKENSKSTAETKTGCMKWYIYDEDNNNYTMILDHNTTSSVNSWNLAEEQLTSDTNTWDKSLNARLIKPDEIAKITKYSSWENTWFYLDTNSNRQGADGTIKSKYAWLYDNTENCEEKGCNIEDTNGQGYWTGVKYSENSSDTWVDAWFIYRNGYLNYCDARFTGNVIRPVITLPKKVIS